jgi:hypothetical protein
MKGTSSYLPIPAPNSAVCAEYQKRWEAGAGSAGVAVGACIVSLLFAACLHITADDAIVKHAEEVRLKEIEAAYGKETAAAIAAKPDILTGENSNVITVVLPPGMAPPKPGEAPPDWVKQAAVVNGVVAYQPPPQAIIAPVTMTAQAAGKNVLFPFVARNSLEISVNPGQHVEILEPPSADGFTKVKIVETGAVGLVPSNYISP